MKKSQQYIEYYKWEKKNLSKLHSSIYKLLNLTNLQFYMPYFSLYFYIHNTKNSHKKIDIKRKYYLIQINEILKEKYYNSNLILNGIIYNSGKNIYEEKELFCKTIPILDPMQLINNNYNLVNHNNYHLPSNYNYNTFNKINDMNNTAYIDVFCSYLFSYLVINNILPSFAIFYGSANGIGNYKYDITDEYADLRVDKCFNQNINKSFKLNMYVSSSESEEEEEYLEEEQSDNSDYNECKDDFIINFEKIPLQLLFIEKLEGTLEDYLMDENFSEEVLISCIFQIAFALNYLQKHYSFTHNDLHICNIMYSNTETQYFYYKINNKYFRIPTYGKIFRIIDFGRSNFTFKGKVFNNDVFSKYSEAYGQYYYPTQVQFHNDLCDIKVKSNYNFDLCRLSMTILDEITDKISNKLKQFLNNMCIDVNGDNFCEMDDDFSLYINISKNAINSLPSKILENNIFKPFRVLKKNFPKKSFYKF